MMVILYTKMIRKGMKMSDDFNKPPHTENSGASNEKKRIPVFLLAIVGIFLAALIFYMVADRNPKPGEVPVDESVPAVQDHSSSNQSATEATAKEALADTATATDH